MHTSSNTEHFCTLFDSNYLPLGMALHDSLVKHALPFHLWILCMDELVEQQLQWINLPYVTLIPLKNIETPELLSVKPERTRGEYCWTLTPHIFQAVFNRDSEVSQVTYLDADLYFFGNPNILLQELPHDKEVLITEHAYSPEYEQSNIHGRFCVQFLTFKRNPAASKVIEWWKEKCLEWCFNRFEDGKFGDQKYLDYWPKLFPKEIYIVQQVEKTLAPWNIKYLEESSKDILKPVFFHYHGLKLVSPNKAQLYLKYDIGKEGERLYSTYISAIQEKIKILNLHNIPIPYFPLSSNPIEVIRRIKWKVYGEIKFKAL